MSALAAVPERTLTEYNLWHHAQVLTDDIDPMYPVLREISNSWDLDAEDRAWLVFLHVVYYHPGSTLAAFQRVPTIGSLPTDYDGLDRLGLLSLPTGTERRGHRSKAALARHLTLTPAILRQEGGMLGWAQRQRAGANGHHGWNRIYDTLTLLPGNGRWAAYKTAEMLQKVAGLPIRAADAGHAYSSGPRKGLADLGLDVEGNGSDAVRTLDAVTAALAAHLGEPDIAQVETSLCDWHSLVKGRYYLGHDIDSMLADFLSPALPKGAVPAIAWDARARVFLPHLLGEHNGWRGIRRARNVAFRDSHVMLGVPETLKAAERRATFGGAA